MLAKRTLASVRTQWIGLDWIVCAEQCMWRRRRRRRPVVEAMIAATWRHSSTRRGSSKSESSPAGPASCASPSSTSPPPPRDTCLVTWFRRGHVTRARTATFVLLLLLLVPLNDNSARCLCGLATRYLFTYFFSGRLCSFKSLVTFNYVFVLVTYCTLNWSLNLLGWSNRPSRSVGQMIAMHCSLLLLTVMAGTGLYLG